MSHREDKRNAYILSLHEINKLSYKKIVPLVKDKYKKKLSRERIGAICRAELKRQKSQISE